MKGKKIKAIILIIIITASLLFLFYNLSFQNDTRELRAVVKKVDDSEISGSGVQKFGRQIVRVEIKEGKYKGKIINASNHLIGNLGWDYRFNEGDEILVAISETENNEIRAAVALDVYRQGWILILIALFIILLILYARYIGLKALFFL